MSSSTQRETLSPRNSDDAQEADGEDDLDMEMAVLALSSGRDIAGPTEDIDLTALSPEEKRLLLAVMRERLGLGSRPDAPKKPQEEPSAS